MRNETHEFTESSIILQKIKNLTNKNDNIQDVCFITLLYLYIQLETKKSPPPSASFFVLTITLSFLEFEWKILYRWKAKMLNFFMV